MKLVYVITRGDDVGGAQIHVRDLCSALAKKGHTVHVITGQTGKFTTLLQEAGIPFHTIESLVHPLHPLKDARALFELVRLLRDLKPDLVSSHSSKAGVLARLAGRMTGIPVVFTAHGWSFTDGVGPAKKRIYRAVERLVAPLSSKIICVSNFDQEIARQHGIASTEKLIAIHNGMPSSSAFPQAEPARSPIRAVMVARMDQQKDHPTLFRALQKVPDVKVDLIGTGPKQAELEQLASKLGIEKQVRFVGYQSQVSALLGEYQLFLLISNYEGFPRSILEAMRAGLPVIASDVGGSKEAVLDGVTGFVVPRGDIELLADRLRTLAQGPALREAMGRSARARFVEHFTFDAMLEKTVGVYQDVVGDAGRTC